MDEEKTFRETIREETGKLSDMTWGARLGYIWDYYKTQMVIVVCIIVAISFGISIYQSKQQKSLLNVYMMDCNSAMVDAEAMEQEFGAYLGGLGEHEYVMVDTQLITESETVSQYSISSQAKLLAVANSGELDMMLLNQNTYESFQKEGYLLELDEILSEEQKDQWSDLLAYGEKPVSEDQTEGEKTENQGNQEGQDPSIYAVQVRDSEVLQRYQAYGDEPVYAALYINARRTAHFGDFCSYLLS